jgi:zinc protease
MKTQTKLLIGLLCGALSLGSSWRSHALETTPADIPDRPEKLTFSPLDYQPPHPEDYRVQLKNGPVAYVATDRMLPLVSIIVYVHAGSFLVPKGQEGLADLAGYLIARGGTTSRTAQDLDERLDFLAAHLNSGLSDSHGTLSLNLLSKDLPEGLQILREVLTAPRFQEDRLSLRKQQLLQQMQERNDHVAAIEARERRSLAFGEAFWLNQLPTASSLQNISRADLQAFHKRWIHPRNFVVAASGDFDRNEMIASLETLFKDWPFESESAPPIPTNTVFAPPGTYVVNKEVNQGRVSIILPGILRDHPDYFAVSVMNHILGGGGFTSRIMNRVRSDEGLAYSAGSQFPGGVHFPATFTASFQTQSRLVPFATSIVLEEIRQIAQETASPAELGIARSSFVEALPRTFATRSRIVSVFAEDELTGRYASNPDYWQNYRANIESVTQEDVQRVARKYLGLENLVVLVVGHKNDILRGHPSHPVSLESLTGHQITELPLRDPLTLRPLNEAGKTADAKGAGG